MHAQNQCITVVAKQAQRVQIQSMFDNDFFLLSQDNNFGTKRFIYVL
jgi:hypothetical protein